MPADERRTWFYAVVRSSIGDNMTDTHLDRALSEEFAGRSAEIHALKAADPAFGKLLERNHELWAEIQKIQESIQPAEDAVLEDMEKRRLKVLDEISVRLRLSRS
jgi:uncharacterized protein YdcH (DUF465 family)